MSDPEIGSIVTNLVGDRPIMHPELFSPYCNRELSEKVQEGLLERHKTGDTETERVFALQIIGSLRPLSLKVWKRLLEMARDKSLPAKYRFICIDDLADSPDIIHSPELLAELKQLLKETIQSFEPKKREEMSFEFDRCKKTLYSKAVLSGGLLDYIKLMLA